MPQDNDKIEQKIETVQDDIQELEATSTLTKEEKTRLDALYDRLDKLLDILESASEPEETHTTLDEVADIIDNPASSVVTAIEPQHNEVNWL